jgi:MFS family permease
MLNADYIEAVAGWAAIKPSWRKTSWSLGLVLAFCATLLFCLGQSLWVLVVARMLQGLSGPVILTTGLAIVADHVDPKNIGYSYVEHTFFSLEFRG